MNKVILFVAVILGLFSIVSAQTPEQLACLDNHNDCAACVALPACGFCGAFGTGYCVPGNVNGSQIAQFGQPNECTGSLWHYSATGSDSACIDTYREVSGTFGTQEAEIHSIAVTGSDIGSASVEALQFVVGQSDSPHMLLGYAKGQRDSLNYTLFGVSMQNFIEYEDLGNDGFNISFIDNTMDPVKFLYPLDQQMYNDMAYANETKEHADGSEYQLYTATVATADGHFALICRVSDSTYEFHNTTYSPYEMKCDILLDGVTYQGTNTSIALNTFVITASGSVVDSAPQNQKLTFGGGLAYLIWDDKIYNGVQSTETCPVAISDVQVGNASVAFDPSATVYTTIYSFLTKDQWSTYYWDPVFGINPTPDVATSGNAASGANSGSTANVASSAQAVASNSDADSENSNSASSTGLSAITLLVLAVIALLF